MLAFRGASEPGAVRGPGPGPGAWVGRSPFGCRAPSLLRMVVVRCDGASTPRAGALPLFVRFRRPRFAAFVRPTALFVWPSLFFRCGAVLGRCDHRFCLGWRCGPGRKGGPIILANVRQPGPMMLTIRTRPRDVVGRVRSLSSLGHAPRAFDVAGACGGDSSAASRLADRVHALLGRRAAFRRAGVGAERSTSRCLTAPPDAAVAVSRPCRVRGCRSPA